jgi:hypothetical protein
MRRVQPADRDSLRVFEISRAANGRDLGDLVVDLPVALARRHQDVLVVFMHHGSDLGWGAYVTGEDGAVLLSFPWTDHVDRILTEADSTELPVVVTEEGWDDLEQGWWGRALVVGSDVYLAETDFDAITDVSDPNRVEHSDPGVVLVDGVEVQWNVVSKDSYDRAWQQAVEACRRGDPSPTGEWASGSEGRRMVVP